MLNTMKKNREYNWQKKGLVPMDYARGKQSPAQRTGKHACGHGATTRNGKKLS